MDIPFAVTEIQRIVGEFSSDALTIMVVILKAVFIPLVVIGAIYGVYKLFVRKAQGK